MGSPLGQKVRDEARFTPGDPRRPTTKPSADPEADGANAVGTQLPVTGAALRFLAATTAYSRVHTGVHYPGDAVVGSLVPGAIGSAVATAARRLV